MIKLTKSELIELAGAYIIANTPASLYYSLLPTSAVKKLQDLRRDELLAYFDKVTARAKRTEFVVALAYAVMIAILTKCDGQATEIDGSRLEWGEPFSKFVRIKNPPTLVTKIDVLSKLPDVRSSSSFTSRLILSQ